jgi:hypothetical protein
VSKVITWIRCGALIACSCNQVFHLDETLLPEAAPLEAPPTCPGFGGTPEFGLVVHQLAGTGGCNSFTLDAAGDELADCGTSFVLGTDPTAFAPIGITDGGTLTFLEPSLVPEGDEVFFTSFDNSTSTFVPQHLVRGAGGAWTASSLVISPPLATVESTLGNATRRGPPRRMLALDFDTERVLQELEEMPTGEWMRVRTYRELDVLSARSIASPWLSSDGLRMMFVVFQIVDMNAVDEHLYYADRASLDDPFGAPRPIASAPPNLRTPFLTDDCARLYFGGLDQILYLEQP